VSDSGLAVGFASGFFCFSSTLGQFLDAGAGVWSLWCHCSWCLRLANDRFVAALEVGGPLGDKLVLIVFYDFALVRR